MTFESIATRYPELRIAVVGDYCLDRYLEIDPSIREVSIETGLPVHNVVRTRPQPGGAGTIAANLAALGIGHILAVGVRGDDGEGYELQRALDGLTGVDTSTLVCRSDRQTFTYTKPVVREPNGPPRELERLDQKNRSTTPPALQTELAQTVARLAPEVDALILLDQVELPETGVVTEPVRRAAGEAAARRADLVVLADSRQGLGHYPPMGLKMNAGELRRTSGRPIEGLAELSSCAQELSRRNRQPVFVTLAENGILGSLDGTSVHHVPAHPTTGPIDVVGAGDSVTANLAAALSAGAGLPLAMEVAMAAASVVVHQLATTGTATREQIAAHLVGRAPR